MINTDADHARDFLNAAGKRGLKILTVGESGESIRLAARREEGEAQALTLVACGQNL